MRGLIGEGGKQGERRRILIPCRSQPAGGRPTRTETGTGTSQRPQAAAVIAVSRPGVSEKSHVWCPQRIVCRAIGQGAYGSLVELRPVPQAVLNNGAVMFPRLGPLWPDSSQATVELELFPHRSPVGSILTSPSASSRPGQSADTTVPPRHVNTASSSRNNTVDGPRQVFHSTPLNRWSAVREMPLRRLEPIRGAAANPSASLPRCRPPRYQ